MGWMNNGLHNPETSGIDPAEPLNTNEGMAPEALVDPDRFDTATYLVECALPADKFVRKYINGEKHDFYGMLGLASEWEYDECDEECQQWVSACLLARTNASEQTVSLWLTGDHDALGFDVPLSHPIYEASFFGNIFADPTAQYVCTGNLVGPLAAQLDGRTCSSELAESCGFTKYHDCPIVDRCDFVGLLRPTAIGCRAGLLPSGDPQPTISTYVEALGVL